MEGMIALRRTIHGYPEPGWAEYRTAATIAEQLTRLGYEVITGRKACHSESRMGVPDGAVLSRYEELAVQEGVDRKWIEQMQGGHTAVVGIIRGSKPGPVIVLRFD
ncbi:MAG: peptidase, partial [Paenibacillus sp.]|nr:peptidase [Paenibacillus sp.]